MMDLFDLDDLIYGLGVEPSVTQIRTLFEEFKRDFIDNELIIDGLKVKVSLRLSKEFGFEEYPEGFVHLITREGASKKRTFDRHRANKIHWVRAILENRKEEDIIYFEELHNDKSIRDYYWYKAEHFLVIMKKVRPDYIVVTSFHIDNQRNEEYYERKYQSFLRNRA